MRDKQVSKSSRTYLGCFFASGQVRDTQAVKKDPSDPSKKRVLHKYRLQLNYKNGEKWANTTRMVWVSGIKEAERELDEWHDAKESEHIADSRSAIVVVDGKKVALGPKTLISDYASAYVKSRKVRTGKDDTGIAQSTYDNYLYSIKHVVNGFADKRMVDLTLDDIRAWETDLQANQGKSGATVVKARILLKNTYEFAARKGHVPPELVASLFPQRDQEAAKAAEPDPNPLTQDSLDVLNAIIDRAYDTGNTNQFTTSIEIALLCGARESEICALTWGDVCFDSAVNYPNGCLVINKTLSRSGKGWVAKEPKTKKGVRTVPLNDDLRGVLLARCEQCISELREAGYDLVGTKPPDSHYVVGNSDGTWLNPAMLSRKWRGFSQGNSLMGVNGSRCVFHDLRHTFATMNLPTCENMAELKTVSEILGHKDIATTLTIYSAALPSWANRMMERTNGKIRKRTKVADVLPIRRATNNQATISA